MDERKWIERILAGTRKFLLPCREVWEDGLYHRFRILENREEAEEAVQDAFVKMYRALSDFHFDSKFSTWFYRIVYRTALTALRQQRMFVSYEEAGPVDLSNDEVESATALLEREDRKRWSQYAEKASGWWGLVAYSLLFGGMLGGRDLSDHWIERF